MFVNGRRLDATGGETTEVINPATGEIVTTVPKASVDDAEKVAKCAREAFDTGAWRRESPRRRERVLRRIGAILRHRADEIASVETLNTGKPIGESRATVLGAALVFDYYAGWATKLSGEQIPVPGSFLDVTFREPVGTCAAIVPWNFPISMATWKVAPALATGNAVVLKPSSLTPLSALLLGEIAAEAGVPDGWFNVVTGPGSSAGMTLVRSPLIDKISFTGETETGRTVAAAAAATLKRVSLELGGKSPAIVLQDADLDGSAVGAAEAVYYNAGQSCDARTRLLVHRAILDSFADAFQHAAEAFRPGDPFWPDTTLPPLISAQHFATVDGWVQTGIEEAGNPFFGGSRVGTEGYYFEPTAFVDVDPHARIATEEIFGPVAVIVPFNDEQDAISIANANPYGLAATIWTRDTARGIRVAREIRAGNVSINGPSWPGPEAPFGGFKSSGYGRELGKEALDLYTEVKNLLIAL